MPLSAVVRERLALAEQKYNDALDQLGRLEERIASLESENAELRAQVPAKPTGHLDDGTHQVAMYLFGHVGDDRDVGEIARVLGMERGVLEYHLDQLNGRGWAKKTGGNYVSGHVYWALTPAGRSYLVENGFIG